MTLRRVLVTLGLLALIGVVAANLGQLSQFPQQIRSVNLAVLLLIVVVQLVGYWCVAKFYESFLALFGHKISVKRLVETSIAVNFVNQAFPSGGLSGMSYFAKDLGGEVPAGKLTLTHLGRYAFTYLSFLVILGTGFLMLFSGGNVDRVTVRLILLFIMGLIGLSIFIVTIIHQRRLAERLVRYPVRAINKLWRVFTRKSRVLISDELLNKFVDDFYHGYDILVQRRGKWIKPLFYTMGGSLGEIATFYVVFLAFGVVINPGVMIAAYTLANIFSLISVFTNGAGVLEATMIAALVALGQPFSLAFSVVLLSRVINMAVFLPLGFYYYRKRV